jgi:hypothetical protein
MRKKSKRPAKQWVWTGGSLKNKIPETAKRQLTARLQAHVAKHWSASCREVLVRFRGGFAYVDALRTEEAIRREFRPRDRGEFQRLMALPTHLCRLGYVGSAERWSFAFYKYSDEKYELCYLPTGDMVGTPEECFDCAANVYLQY